MNKEFVSYNQALALKELGFDEPCLAGYIKFRGSGTFELAFYKNRNVDFNTTSNIYVSAPLKQQIFRWCREKHNLISWVYISHSEFFYVIVENDRFVKGVGSKANYDEAEDACINKLIEIVKNK